MIVKSMIIMAENMASDKARHGTGAVAESLHVETTVMRQKERGGAY